MRPLLSYEKIHVQSKTIWMNFCGSSPVLIPIYSTNFVSVHLHSIHRSKGDLLAKAVSLVNRFFFGDNWSLALRRFLYRDTAFSEYNKTGTIGILCTKYDVSLQHWELISADVIVRTKQIPSHIDNSAVLESGILLRTYHYPVLLYSGKAVVWCATN